MITLEDALNDLDTPVEQRRTWEDAGRIYKVVGAFSGASVILEPIDAPGTCHRFHLGLGGLTARGLQRGPTAPVAGPALSANGEDGWMPIETAPLDGSKYLAWDKSTSSPWLVYWDAKVGARHPNRPCFTHWQPLPAPTAAATTTNEKVRWMGKRPTLKVPSIPLLTAEQVAEKICKMWGLAPLLPEYMAKAANEIQVQFNLRSAHQEGAAE